MCAGKFSLPAVPAFGVCQEPSPVPSACAASPSFTVDSPACSNVVYARSARLSCDSKTAQPFFRLSFQPGGARNFVFVFLCVIQLSLEPGALVVFVSPLEPVEL